MYSLHFAFILRKIALVDYNYIIENFKRKCICIYIMIDLELSSKERLLFIIFFLYHISLQH